MTMSASAAASGTYPSYSVKRRRPLRRASAASRRAGAVLLDRGWIKPAELIPTVRLHLEDLVYAILLNSANDAAASSSANFGARCQVPNPPMECPVKPWRDASPGKLSKITVCNSVVT